MVINASHKKASFSARIEKTVKLQAFTENEVSYKKCLKTLESIHNLSSLPKPSKLGIEAEVQYTKEIHDHPDL